MAIDGEGATGFDGRHHYLYLAACDGAGNSFQLPSPDGQTLAPGLALDFLYGLPEGYIYISFFSGYDWTMILKELPRKKLEGLWDRDSRTVERSKGGSYTNPVEWFVYDRFGLPMYCWDLDYIPGKEFSFRRYDFRTDKTGPWRRIWDCGGFFQTSLVTALQGWNIGTEEEKAFVSKMKAKRSSFTPFMGDTEKRYCILECKLLCGLMDAVRAETEGQGFTLRRFSGAGSLAASILTEYSTRDAIGKLPKAVEEASSRAYFGGRFEACIVGPCDGPIYEYDIRSAYPSIIQDLPCLACGKWRKVKDFDPSMRWALWRVDWDIPWFVKEDNWYYGYGPFPFRTKTGYIRYPLRGRGWYYTKEVIEAIRIWGDCITVKMGHVYTPDGSCPHGKPFGFVGDLYSRRAELKAEGHAGEKVLKLGLNSLYGKLAQTVGTRPYASPVWAGLITSETRAKLLTCLDSSQYPSAIMFATDAVFSLRKPLPLEIGTELGQWEEHRFDDIFIVQPGIYAVNYKKALADGRAMEKVRTRGFGRQSFILTDALEAWRTMMPFQVEYPIFVGIGAALQSDKLVMGSWGHKTHRISFQPGTKRMVISELHKHRGAHYFPPYPLDEPYLSAPYKPLATDAMQREWARVVAEQPDPPSFLEMLGDISLAW